MKKLFTLFIFLCAALSASADEYTVYFKPNADWQSATEVEWFALCMVPKSGWDNRSVVRFTETSASGIYKATYNTQYDGKIQILRMDPSYSSLSTDHVWNWSLDLACPTSNVYYTMSDDYNGDWNHFGWNVVVPSDKTFSISSEGNDEILPNFLDSEEGINLESKGDFTYTRTVVGNLIPAAAEGTYGFKLYDESGNWYSDTKNNYNKWPVSGISTTEDGEYTIVYSFNFITGEASAVAKRTAVAHLSEKYIVAGSEALTGYDWDSSGNYNVMTVADGVATLSFSNKSLVANYNEYKIVHLMYNDANVYKTEWKGNPNDKGKNFTCNIARTSIYNVVFEYNISSGNATCTPSEVSGYFIYGGSGSNSWAIGSRMTEKDGIYYHTFNGNTSFNFVLTPNSNLAGNNTVSDWAQVIRPDAGLVNISWTANQNGNTIIANAEAKKWNIAYDGYITLAYNPTDGTWSATPYIPAELKEAAGGYATFSSKKNVAIPGDIKAFYPTRVSDKGVISWAEFTKKGIPANQGALLQGEVGPYKFTPAAEDPDVVPDNAKTTITMEPIDATVAENPLQQIETTGYTNYILALGSESNSIGFCKVNRNGSYVNAGTAYLKVKDEAISTTLGAPAFFPLTGETTAIDNLTTETAQKGEEKIYSLDGRRIVGQPTAKGIYIVNGKKLLKK